MKLVEFNLFANDFFTPTRLDITKYFMFSQIDLELRTIEWEAL